MTVTTAAQRWLARLAFLAAAAAVVVLLAAAGVRSLALVAIGAAGLAVALVAVWWFLVHRRVLRWLAAVLALAALVTVAVLYVRAGLVWSVVLCAALWAVAGAAGRAALARGTTRAGPTWSETPPPERPFLIMNPRSGGGKVGRFDLAGRARALGADVELLEGPETVDVEALARQAVARGADLLGVAGGDGTQALVAAVAAENGVPFMVISAGTRNHFAMDLGLDRDDPSTCLDALSDGVEVRIDLARIGDRMFVNNASFGAYASVVQSPAYRDDKTATTLDLLPDLLVGHRGPRLRLRAGNTVVTGPQAILVSNNPYAATDIAGLGRRDRIDTGVLGVLAATVGGAADAVHLLRGRHSKVLTLVTATEVTVDADAATIPVGVDGEAVAMPTPVRCVIHPGALRVRVPRHRPGVRPVRPAMDWARLRHFAVSTGGPAR
ncbi:MAG: diacylglycerol kinase [Actinobacteria bacterium 13_2_20CM_2_71_6]|nr:MAG: diacylglycerol kinase [Actinobacteria bacterium 13_2_20CM_2_71_6]